MIGQQRLLLGQRLVALEQSLQLLDPCLAVLISERQRGNDQPIGGDQSEPEQHDRKRAT